jgi:hypothetical protein
VTGVQTCALPIFLRANWHITERYAPYLLIVEININAQAEPKSDNKGVLTKYK